MSNVQEYIYGILDKAKRTTRRPDLTLGNYVFTVTGLTYERRAKREKLGKVFWIDVIVDQSESTTPGVTPNPPGTTLDFPISLEGQYAEMSARDLANFFYSLTGSEKTSQCWKDLVECVTDEGVRSNTAQAGRGMQVYATTYTRTTKGGKNAGQDRVYPRWGADPLPQTPAEVAERRKKLDFGK